MAEFLILPHEACVELFVGLVLLEFPECSPQAMVSC